MQITATLRDLSEESLNAITSVFEIEGDDIPFGDELCDTGA